MIVKIVTLYFTQISIPTFKKEKLSSYLVLLKQYSNVQVEQANLVTLTHADALNLAGRQELPPPFQRQPLLSPRQVMLLNNNHDSLLLPLLHLVHHLRSPLLQV